MYSEQLPTGVAESTRQQKAQQICAVLERHCGSLGELAVLDYGCSTGVTTAYFATRFRRVVGADVDETALQKARLQFPDIAFKSFRHYPAEETFDVVVANQIYNCVEDQQTLLDDIYGRLNRGGVCYFSGRNKYALVERQYHLPLLSMLPSPLARLYLRLCRGTWHSVGPHYRSRRQLLRLFRRFAVRDYTLEILRQPEAFSFSDVPRFIRHLPLGLLVDFIPNYVFVLQKT